MPTSTLPSRPSLRLYLVVYAFVSLLIDFGGIHIFHHSDTFVFSLASLQKWTVFFWEQDRVGMFFPWLTCWCSDPLSTILIQTWLTIFVGLCVPLLLVELFDPCPTGRAAATLANTLLLAVAPTLIRSNVLIDTCYPQGMVFGLTGLLLYFGGSGRLTAWRCLAALFCFGLAHWAYLGIVVWLFPLAVGKSLLNCRGLRLGRGAMVLVFLTLAFGFGFWMSRHVRDANPLTVNPTPMGAVPLDHLPRVLKQFVEHPFDFEGMTLWYSLAGGLGLSGILGLALRRHWPGRWWLAVLFWIAVAAASELVAVGSRRWAELNGTPPRHILATLISVPLLGCLLAAAPIREWGNGKGRWWLAGMGVASLLLAGLCQFGMPAIARPTADIHAIGGSLTREVMEAKVDAMGGDYWTVWRTLFDATLWQGTSCPPIYGITPRGVVFHKDWARTNPEGMQVAVPKTELDRKEFFATVARYGLSQPLLTTEKGSLEIYTLRPAPVLMP